MKRLILATGLALVGGSGMGLAAHPALAAILCVGGPGCFSTIQAALSAAHDGDVIHIAPGTYSGSTPRPIVITKSVAIIGAGAGKTIIEGGGPVVTIGTYLGGSQLTVSITGVTITGGFNTSIESPIDNPGVVSSGGIDIPPSICTGNNPPQCLGATVTITDSVITGNTAKMVQTAPCCDGGGFALALGGGILNGGILTLDHTTVSNNTAGADGSLQAFFSLAAGGGIHTNSAATLILHDSTVSGNRLSLVTTDGLNRLAFGGGINSDGPTTMDGSTVTGNSITLSSTATDPKSDLHGVGGGIHLTGPATIRNSLISGNSVTASGVTGFLVSASGGIDEDGSLLLQDSTVSNNWTSSIVTSNDPNGNAQSSAGGMEADGQLTVENTRFTGNSSSATSYAGALNGVPLVIGGGLVIPSGQPNTITDSVISGNSATATTTTGTPFVGGGGMIDFGCAPLTLRNTVVSNNRGTATGPPGGGAAQGGGILNGTCGPVPVPLTLIDSAVVHNSLTASSGIPVQGGGVFNVGTIVLTNTVVAGNAPDQCFGC